MGQQEKRKEVEVYMTEKTISVRMSKSDYRHIMRIILRKRLLENNLNMEPGTMDMESFDILDSLLQFEKYRRRTAKTARYFDRQIKSYIG